MADLYGVIDVAAAGPKMFDVRRLIGLIWGLKYQVELLLWKVAQPRKPHLAEATPRLEMQWYSTTTSSVNVLSYTKPE